MEEFAEAYSVRLLAHTGRYLWADPDLKSVSQKKGKDTKGVIWRVELVPERGAIRLKSVHDLYLHASDYAFLLGATGKKVTQSYASKADSSLEWVPEKYTPYVKLKARSNKYLRANRGVPPYRNSVTHDLPVLQGNQHVVLWTVEVVRTKDAPSLQPSRLLTPRHVRVFFLLCLYLSNLYGIFLCKNASRPSFAFSKSVSLYLVLCSLTRHRLSHHHSIIKKRIVPTMRPRTSRLLVAPRHAIN